MLAFLLLYRGRLFLTLSLEFFTNDFTALFAESYAICQNIFPAIIPQGFVISAIFDLLHCFFAGTVQFPECRSIFQFDNHSRIQIFRLNQDITETVSRFDVGADQPVTFTPQQTKQQAVIKIFLLFITSFVIQNTDVRCFWIFSASPSKNAWHSSCIGFVSSTIV